MIDACFGISVLLIAAFATFEIIRTRRSDERMDRLRECTDELCRLDGRYTQIERSAKFGVDVETRARMHDDLMRDKDETIARHQRAFPELK